MKRIGWTASQATDEEFSRRQLTYSISTGRLYIYGGPIGRLVGTHVGDRMNLSDGSLAND